MKFGEIDVCNAAGAALAHGLRTEKIDLKKGHILAAQDVDALIGAGIAQVTAVRFEENDIKENLAAAIAALALLDAQAAKDMLNARLQDRSLLDATARLNKMSASLCIDKAFTGRVNIFAKRAGVFKVNAGTIDKVNGIDPDITVATLNNHEAVRRGQMLATVKIIPFAVNERSLGRVCDVTDEPSTRESAALTLAPFKPKRAVLIQTTLQHTSLKMLDKTARITAERMRAVGGRLVEERRCAHDTQSLRHTISEMSDHDILLIAGATAITDRRDVLPSAIETAGGELCHFGMPVDPGNLLLLARYNDRPVIGLPGCARSPKLNGFDWVLQRLAADIDVSADDITGMGVGGLLTEIPNRPQPRSKQDKSTADVKSTSANKRIGAIVLAAGQSRRMGKVNKLTADIEGRPMVCHVAETLLAAGLSDIIVVTGHEREMVEEALGRYKFRFAHNDEFQDGLSTSLRAGLMALENDLDGVIVVLGDMPGIPSSLISQMIKDFDPENSRAIIVPTYQGKRGNPVLWANDFVPELLDIEGDVGAKHLIGRHADVVHMIEAQDDMPLTDLDTPQALERYRRDVATETDH